MTLAELRVIVSDIQLKANTLREKSDNLCSLLDGISSQISTGNQFAETIFTDAVVNALVTAQTPVYIQKLTEIEIAADALSTDQFN